MSLLEQGWFKKEEDNKNKDKTFQEVKAIEDHKEEVQNLSRESIADYESIHGNTEEVLIKTQLLKDQMEELDTDFHVTIKSNTQPNQLFEKRKTEFITSISELNQKLKNLSEFDPSIQSQMIKFDKVSGVVRKFLGSILTEGDINTVIEMLWDENKKALFNTLSEVETILMQEKTLDLNNLN